MLLLRERLSLAGRSYTMLEVLRPCFDDGTPSHKGKVTAANDRGCHSVEKITGSGNPVIFIDLSDDAVD